MTTPRRMVERVQAATQVVVCCAAARGLAILFEQGQIEYEQRLQS